MRSLLSLVLMCVLVAAAQPDDSQDSDTNWSTLGFLQAANQDQDTSTDLIGEASEQMSSKVLPDYEYMDRPQRPFRRRKNRYRMKKRPAYMDFEQQIDDNSLYERDGPVASDDYESSSSYSSPSSSYVAPTSNSYSAPSYDDSPSYAAPSYSAPSYSAPSYAAQSYDAPSYVGGSKDTFNDFLNALAAFLPIGLFLAAIPPNLIVINSARKKRESVDESENIIPDYSYPFLDKIGKLGYSGLQETGCQKRILCEMSELGATESGNSVQRILAYAAALTPDTLAQYIHAKDIFQAVRAKSCEKFKCSVF